jgi:hypothetical protein
MRVGLPSPCRCRRKSLAVLADAGVPSSSSPALARTTRRSLPALGRPAHCTCFRGGSGISRATGCVEREHRRRSLTTTTFGARAPTPKSAAGQQISIPTDQARAAGLRPEIRGRSDRFRRLRRAWPFPSRVLCWHRRGVRPFDDASSADARRSAALSRRRLPLRRGRARR